MNMGVFCFERKSTINCDLQIKIQNLNVQTQPPYDVLTCILQGSGTGTDCVLVYRKYVISLTLLRHVWQVLIRNQQDIRGRRTQMKPLYTF